MNLGIWERIKNSMREDYRNGKFTGTGDDNKSAISQAAQKGKGFVINSPSSTRTATKSNGSYINNNGFEIGDTTDQYPEGQATTFGVASTAVDSARYDPEDNSLNITYKGGDKEYKFKADPEDVEEWVNAPSKGRITQEWKTTHRYPGY